jgi:hypothetical protein
MAFFWDVTIFKTEQVAYWKFTIRNIHQAFQVDEIIRGNLDAGHVTHTREMGDDKFA